MKVVFKVLVKEKGKKRSELGEKSLGSIEMDSPPRAKGTRIFFNDDYYKIYKSFDWIYVNNTTDGMDQSHLELILELV